jgi:hypothetical protein
MALIIELLEILYSSIKPLKAIGKVITDPIPV